MRNGSGNGNGNDIGDGSSSAVVVAVAVTVVEIVSVVLSVKKTTKIVWQQWYNRKLNWKEKEKNWYLLCVPL